MGGVGPHLEEFAFNCVQLGETSVDAIVDGLRSGMMPCLKKLVFAWSVLNQELAKERIEKALKESGEGKGVD